MSIYFVRHGQTDWNITLQLQGGTDICLNETGKKQARQTRENLKGTRIDKIYCSPLSRARETAEIINELWHAEIVVDDRLKERCFGVMEGIPRKEIPVKDLWAASWEPLFRESEPAALFYKRIGNFLDDVVEDALHREILIVAHGGVSIPYQYYFEGYQASVPGKELIAGNCEVIHYSVEEIRRALQRHQEQAEKTLKK